MAHSWRTDGAPHAPLPHNNFGAIWLTILVDDNPERKNNSAIGPPRRPLAHVPRMSTDPSPDIEQRLYQSIASALMAGKLRPGMPLRERNLAELFGTTRGAVRKVLARLGQEGKLELLQNRGAFVPQPSPEDVADIYGARAIVEAGLVAALAMRLTQRGGRGALARLKSHVEAEEAACRAQDRETSVRLAGEFHLKLAELVGNDSLLRYLEQLIARTQLFVALYEARDESHCAPDEHRRIVAALDKGDVAAAIATMSSHLADVQARVLAHMAPTTDIDLADVLGAPLA
ncbi:GntR family transcriptional regulator [Cupriavidus cauae]|nr:GntR family transcriptional regulator [Cupriavidus cauae]